MNEDEISLLLAPCGLYCGWCPYYVQGTEDFQCSSCWKREKCPIRDCAREKELKLCTYCSSFPCDKLSQMYGHMNEFFDRIKMDFLDGIAKRRR